MVSSQATVVPAFHLPSSRGESFGDYCTKTRKGTGLSFWCKVYYALILLCCTFDRDRWSQRSTSRQKPLEVSGRVGAILTTVASCGCPQWGADHVTQRQCGLWPHAFLAQCCAVTQLATTSGLLHWHIAILSKPSQVHLTGSVCVYL